MGFKLKLGTLGVDLTMDDKSFRKGSSAAQASMGDLIGKAGKMAAGFFAVDKALALAGAAIGGFAGEVSAAVQASAALNAKITDVSAVSSASTKDFEAFRAAAVSASLDSAFSAIEAGEALEFMAMAGMTATDSTAALPDVLSLAAASSTDLATSANVLTNVLSAFNLQTDDLAHTNDVLTGALTRANTNLTDLGSAIKQVGPVASSAGQDIESIAAAVGVLGNAGISGAQAGTQLRGTIASLLSPSKQAKSELDALGAKVLDAEGNMRPLVDILRELEAAGITGAQVFKIFGRENAAAVSALLPRLGEFNSLTNDLRHNVDGLAGDIESVKLDTINGQLSILTGTMDTLRADVGNASDAIGKDFLKSMNVALGGVQNFKDEIYELNQSTQEADKHFKSLSDTTAAFTSVSIGEGIAAINTLVGVVNSLGGSVDELGGDVDLGEAAVLGLTAAVKGFVAAGTGGLGLLVLNDNINEFRDSVLDTKDSIENFKEAEVFVDDLKEKIADLADEMERAFKSSDIGKFVTAQAKGGQEMVKALGELFGIKGEGAIKEDEERRKKEAEEAAKAERERLAAKERAAEQAKKQEMQAAEKRKELARAAIEGAEAAKRDEEKRREEVSKAAEESLKVAKQKQEERAKREQELSEAESERMQRVDKQRREDAAATMQMLSDAASAQKSRRMQIMGTISQGIFGTLEDTFSQIDSALGDEGGGVFRALNAGMGALSAAMAMPGDPLMKAAAGLTSLASSAVSAVLSTDKAQSQIKMVGSLLKESLGDVPTIEDALGTLDAALFVFGKFAGVLAPVINFDGLMERAARNLFISMKNIMLALLDVALTFQKARNTILRIVQQIIVVLRDMVVAINRALPNAIDIPTDKLNSAIDSLVGAIIGSEVRMSDLGQAINDLTATTFEDAAAGARDFEDTMGDVNDELRNAPSGFKRILDRARNDAANRQSTQDRTTQQLGSSAIAQGDVTINQTNNFFGEVSSGKRQLAEELFNQMRRVKFQRLGSKDITPAQTQAMRAREALRR